jgi:hypothetical protein
VPASLPVELNIDRLHDIDVPPTFVATGSFTIDLENQAEAVHVHLHLDDTLSQVARLSTNNHFVEAGSTRPVTVDVRRVDEAVTGKLKVVTGHGNETEYVEVTVEPAVKQKEPVKVDESLSRPKQPDPEPTLRARTQEVIEETTTPVVVLAGIAILLALGVGVVANSAVVLLTAGVVVLGVVAALAFLLR